MTGREKNKNKKQSLYNIKLAVSNIKDLDVRKKTFVFLSSAVALTNYLESSGINVDIDASNSVNSFILDEFDSAALRVNNLQIDVRPVIGSEYPEMWIPKKHFDYGLPIDIYVGVKITPGSNNIEFVGFITSSDINRRHLNKNFYIVNSSNFRNISEINEALQEIKPRKVDFSDSDHQKTRELFLSYIDDEISRLDKKFLLKHLANCDSCSKEFNKLLNLENKFNSINNLQEVFEDTSYTINTSQISFPSGGLLAANLLTVGCIGISAISVKENKGILGKIKRLFKKQTDNNKTDISKIDSDIIDENTAFSSELAEITDQNPDKYDQAYTELNEVPFEEMVENFDDNEFLSFIEPEKIDNSDEVPSEEIVESFDNKGDLSFIEPEKIDNSDEVPSEDMVESFDDKGDLSFIEPEKIDNSDELASEEMVENFDDNEDLSFIEPEKIDNSDELASEEMVESFDDNEDLSFIEPEKIDNSDELASEEMMENFDDNEDLSFIEPEKIDNSDEVLPEEIMENFDDNEDLVIIQPENFDNSDELSSDEMIQINNDIDDIEIINLDETLPEFSLNKNADNINEKQIKLTDFSENILEEPLLYSENTEDNEEFGDDASRFEENIDSYLESFDSVEIINNDEIFNIISGMNNETNKLEEEPENLNKNFNDQVFQQENLEDINIGDDFEINIMGNNPDIENDKILVKKSRTALYIGAAALLTASAAIITFGLPLIKQYNSNTNIAQNMQNMQANQTYPVLQGQNNKQNVTKQRVLDMLHNKRMLGHIPGNKGTNIPIIPGPNNPNLPPISQANNTETKNINSVFNKAFMQGSSLSVSNVSWEVGVSLVNNPIFKNYLLVSGLAIKNDLSKQLENVHSFALNHQIKVQIILSLKGDVLRTVITKSSGTAEIDNAILQTVTTAFSYTKLPQITTNKKFIKTTLIINL